jgi:hypothetical protein
MRQILSRSVLTVAAAGGVLAAAGGYASADSGAHGTAEGSPGLLSGNSVSAPVEVPVNVCGNSVDAVGLLNPAFGNACSNGTPAPPTAQTPPPTTPTPATPVPTTPQRQVPEPRPVHHDLAETGIGGGELGGAAALAAALLFGGALLYRRGGRTAPARAGHGAGPHADRGARAGHARR